MNCNSLLFKGSILTLISFLSLTSFSYGQSPKAFIFGNENTFCGSTANYTVQEMSSGNAHEEKAEWYLRRPNSSEEVSLTGVYKSPSVNVTFDGGSGTYILYARKIEYKEYVYDSNGNVTAKLKKTAPDAELSITVTMGLLNIPGSITVSSNVMDGPHLCANNNGTVDIAPVSNATQYRWVAPSGWSFAGGGNTYLATNANPVQLRAPSGSGTATIQVRAEAPNSSCYSSSPYRTLSVTYGPRNYSLSAAQSSIGQNEGVTVNIQDDRGITNNSITWTEPFSWDIVGGQGTIQGIFNSRNSNPGNYNINVSYQSCGFTYNKSVTIEVTSGSGGGIGLPGGGFGRSENAMEEGDVNFAVFPNPAQGFVNVQSLTGLAQVRVLSTTGKVLQTQAVTGQQAKITLNNLESGLYLLEITDERGEVSLSRIAVE